MTEEKKREIDEVVRREWTMFRKVQNEGGRADCQDDWDTFHVMREAQYAPWPEPLINMLNVGLMYAEETGRNVMSEKYARMMAGTAPEKYREIEDRLPPVKDSCRELAEKIIAIHKKWMAAHAETYPALSAQGRPLYTEQDTEWNTSSETYLRGELLTWQEDLLRAYLQFVKECEAQGRNLVAEQDAYAVKAYGYASLEEAEEIYSSRKEAHSCEI